MRFEIAFETRKPPMRNPFLQQLPRCPSLEASDTMSRDSGIRSRALEQTNSTSLPRKCKLMDFCRSTEVPRLPSRLRLPHLAPSHRIQIH